MLLVRLRDFLVPSQRGQRDVNDNDGKKFGILRNATW